METSKTSFKVPAENINKLTDQIETINKRVARLVKKGYSVKPIVIKVGEMYVEQVKEGERSVDRVYANVDLIAPEPPRVQGWEFVAALTHVDDVGTVLRVCPGANISEGELKQYRNASPKNCDHCHTVRQRNDTFIIRRLP